MVSHKNTQEEKSTVNFNEVKDSSFIKGASGVGLGSSVLAISIPLTCK